MKVPNTMSSIKKQVILIALMGLLISVVGCSDQSDEGSKKAKQVSLQFQTTQVTVERLPIVYRTTGTVVSDHRVDVTSRTTGYIRKILVREGDNVKKGQALLTLDGADVEGAIRQMAASVNKATSALKDAQTDLDNFKALFKRGSVSENALRKVTLRRDTAKDTLREVKAALDTTQSQRQYTQITSPVTGVVVARHKRQGDLATPAIPLVTVESSNGLLFETYIAEGQIKNIKQGDEVEVSIDAIETSIKGVIARIVPSADPFTRKLRVKVSLSDNEKLLPGMFGRTHFEVGIKMLPTIHVGSIVTRAGLSGVFLVDDELRIHFRWLRLGKTSIDQVEVLVGLKGGDQIVSKPDGRLRDGDLIELKGNVSGQ